MCSSLKFSSTQHSHQNIVFIVYLKYCDKLVFVTFTHVPNLFELLKDINKTDSACSRMSFSIILVLTLSKGSSDKYYNELDSILKHQILISNYK